MAKLKLRKVGDNYSLTQTGKGRKPKPPKPPKNKK